MKEMRPIRNTGVTSNKKVSVKTKLAVSVLAAASLAMVEFGNPST